MILEKEIVSGYVGSIEKARDDAERALVDAGYNPEELMKFFEMQENEIVERLGNCDFIPNGDYSDVVKNVECLFDNRLTIFNSKQKDVSYRADDTYRMSSAAFCQVSMGLGRKFEVHEKRHRQQKKELGGLEPRDIVFAEGDAESFAIEKLFGNAGVKDAAIKYACLNQTLNRNNSLKDIKLGCSGCAPRSRDYVLYVLVPAVVSAMKKNGASYTEIRDRFAEAAQNAQNGRGYFESLRDGLLEGIDAA